MTVRALSNFVRLRSYDLGVVGSSGHYLLRSPPVWTENDSHGFANEQDYLQSQKKDDSYTFTYPFEYIVKNYGNDEYDVDTADMVVQVEWSDAQAGYVVSYDVPDIHKIDPAQGNSDADGFYESDVHWRLTTDLGSFGIGPELIAI